MPPTAPRWLVAAALLLTTGGCAPQPVVQDDQGIEASESIIAAIHALDSIPLDSSGYLDYERLQPGDTIVRGDGIARIAAETRLAVLKSGLSAAVFSPEASDEQHLIESASYGPFASIFVSDKMESDVLPNDLVLVAMIKALGTYAPLQLQPGTNCVYIEGVAAGAKGKAHIVQPPLGSDCNDTISTGTPNPLEVYRTQWPDASNGANNASYPLTARFDFDEGSGINYFGFKCGKYWCEAGPQGFQLSQDNSNESLKTKAVKGWYDYQVLAEITTGKKVKQSIARGTARPVEDLGSKTDADFAAGWVHVASAEIDRNVKKYKDEFNLWPGQDTEIFLCNNTTCATEATNGGLTKACAGTYRARFDRANKSVYRCVDRIDHSNTSWGAKIPGTARWKWSATDEMFWMRCGYGCCQVS